MKAMPGQDNHINAADGRMLCLLSHTGKCTVATFSAEAPRKHQSTWMRLLDVALSEDAHALIDAGKRSGLSCQNTQCLCMLPQKTSAASPQLLIANNLYA